jgi:hypothetical protein
MKRVIKQAKKGAFMKPLQKLYTRLAGAFGIVGISLFFLIFSCTQKLPTVPPDRALAFNPGHLNLVVVNPGTPVTVTIGPAGDTVAFPVGSDSAYFIVPPGAVDSAVTFSFSAQLSKTPDGQITISIYDFGPAGLVFTNDCYLVHPSRFKDGTQIPLYWFDLLSKQWVLEGSASVNQGKAFLVIKHFSDYSAPIDALSSSGQ